MKTRGFKVRKLMREMELIGKQTHPSDRWSVNTRKLPDLYSIGLLWKMNTVTMSTSRS